MKTIWKYKTQFNDSFELKMPLDSEILSIHLDKKDNKPCLWALVDTEKPLIERYFELFGTGNPIHEDMGIQRKFIGTYQYQRGAFVGHLFERLD